MDTRKIEENVSKFLEAFGRLGPDEKLYFLAEIDKQMKEKDEKDRKLFMSLIKAAREGMSISDTIEAMRKA